MSIPLRSALVDDAIRDLVAAQDVGAALVVPGRLSTLGFALTALLALIAAALRSPKWGAGALATFLAFTIVAPTLSQVLGGGGGGGPASVSMAMDRTAAVLLEWSLPTLLLLLGGALDLFGAPARRRVFATGPTSGGGPGIGAGDAPLPFGGTTTRSDVP